MKVSLEQRRDGLPVGTTKDLKYGGQGGTKTPDDRQHPSIEGPLETSRPRVVLSSSFYVPRLLPKKGHQSGTSWYPLDPSFHVPHNLLDSFP